MTRINTGAFTKNTISQIYAIKDKIDLSPDYQRQGELWNKYKKQLFLDSIFNGFDIPKLYLHVLQTPSQKDSKTFQYAVIDGRQRLETLWEFIEGQLKLGDFDILYRNKELNLDGYTYDKLAQDYPGLRGYFDDYELPIIAVKTEEDDDELIEDMFSRLNEAVAINAAEKRNAKQGKMIELVRKLALHEFFTNKVSFKNKRLQHHEVAVRLLFLENCIYKKELIDTKKQFLDTFVDDYKEKNPGFPIFDKVITVLNAMCDNFEEKDLLLKKQGRVLIYYLVYRQAMNQNLPLDRLRDKIIHFNDEVEANKELAKNNENSVKFDLYQYDRYTIQGTNDASSIKTRFHIIAKHLRIKSEEIDLL